MWVVAIRSGMDWRFDPGPDDVVSVGDVLLIRGPEEGVNHVRELAGAPPFRRRPRRSRRPSRSLTAPWTSSWS